MAGTTNEVIELLKKRLEEIEGATSGQKAEIEKAFKDAVSAANKAQKDAIAIATKSKAEALSKIDVDKAEKASIIKALQALGERVPFPRSAKAEGERVPFPKSAKAPANFTVPRTYDEAKSDNQKVYFAISEIGSGIIADILVKVNGYGASFDTKGVSNAVNNLKNKFQVITEDGKVGKAMKYKIA